MTHDPKIQIVNKQIAYAGFNNITNYTFEFLSFDGQSTLKMDKEIFERKDAVAALLYDPTQDLIVLVEQFRPGCFVAEGIAFPLEIPAGLVDKNKYDLEQTMIAEIKEETGCDTEKLVPIGAFYPEISFGSRRIHLFCAKINATQLQAIAGLANENEQTRVKSVTSAELRILLDTGALINSHTLIAVQWFFLNFDKICQEFSIKIES